VSRQLKAMGLAVSHVLPDGQVEPHAATERRLLVCEGLEHDDFLEGPEERLARAYRQRARKAAYAEDPPETAVLGAAG
jgi:hypothetical protein